jgi:hypothetical protein
MPSYDVASILGWTLPPCAFAFSFVGVGADATAAAAAGIKSKFDVALVHAGPQTPAADGAAGAVVAFGGAAPWNVVAAVRMLGRGLHSFPIQLNLSSSVHRITRLSS